jgi:hypothetical protein
MTAGKGVVLWRRTIASVTQRRSQRAKRRAVRFRFDVLDRREGDVQGVDVVLGGQDGVVRSLRVDFDDRSTIVSDKGDEHAFNDEGVAVEGYQKSNLKGDGLVDLHYGVIVKDVTAEFTRARLHVREVRDEHPACVEVGIPELHNNERPVHSRADFDDPPFPRRAGSRLCCRAMCVARSGRRAGWSARPALSGPAEPAPKRCDNYRSRRIGVHGGASTTRC